MKRIYHSAIKWTRLVTGSNLTLGSIETLNSNIPLCTGIRYVQLKSTFACPPSGVPRFWYGMVWYHACDISAYETVQEPSMKGGEPNGQERGWSLDRFELVSKFRWKLLRGPLVSCAPLLSDSCLMHVTYLHAYKSKIIDTLARFSVLSGASILIRARINPWVNWEAARINHLVSTTSSHIQGTRTSRGNFSQGLITPPHQLTMAVFTTIC